MPAAKEAALSDLRDVRDPWDSASAPEFSTRSSLQASRRSGLPHADAPAKSRPVNNQSSVEGGIFATDVSLPPQKPGGNARNKASVPGGVLSPAHEAFKPPKPDGNRSQKSSAPGGNPLALGSIDIAPPKRSVRDKGAPSVPGGIFSRDWDPRVDPPR